MVLRPPSILYKYFPVEGWLRHLLTGESLKFASRTEFNDPFDSRAAYQIEKGHAGRQYVRDKLRSANLTPAKRLIAAQQAHRVSAKPRLFGSYVSDGLLDGIGLLCLTEAWSNPLLWAHYAAKHAGLCVGFRTDNDVFYTAQRINYTETLPVIHRPSDSNKLMVEKALLTKDVCWAYEKEWRILKVNKPRSYTEEQYRFWPEEHRRYMVDQKRPGIYQFDASTIESVTMGLCISPDDERSIRQLVTEVAPLVPLYRIVRSVDKYELRRELVRRVSR